MDKYQDWSKVLIEPASLNEARLFALESRMHEEEEIRIKEGEFVRDHLKKLIYSMEKSSVAQLDQQISTFPSSLTAQKYSVNQGGDNSLLTNNTPQLPSLTNNISA